MHRLLLLLFLSLALPLSSATDQKSIHEVLRSNGLPIGLVPNKNKEFSIDSDGFFVLRLDRPCDVKFENEVHYDWEIQGRIGYGEMKNLTGIVAKELFLWLPVKGIRVDVPSSGLIYFDVGVVLKQFPVSLFEVAPDCDEVNSGKIRQKIEQEDLQRIAS